MSSSHQSTIISLEQAKNNYGKVNNKYLMYFHISQIVPGKGPCVKEERQNFQANVYFS